MCGIVAIINNTREISEDALRDAVEALIPRGPDEQSTWFSDNRRVALGHPDEAPGQ